MRVVEETYKKQWQMYIMEESHKTSGRLFKLVNRMHMVRQMPHEGVMR